MLFKMQGCQNVQFSKQTNKETNHKTESLLIIISHHINSLEFCLIVFLLLLAAHVKKKN